MPANRYFAISLRAEPSGNDLLRISVGTHDKAKLGRHFLVELAMH